MTELTEVWAPDARPLWRRIVDFPLVAMLLGIAVIAVGIVTATFTAKWLVPDIPNFTFEMKFDLVCAPLLIILYKLISWASIGATTFASPTLCVRSALDF
jgi:uncharacterized membrane-anchored protein YitT (DUF2179 family)